MKKSDLMDGQIVMLSCGHFFYKCGQIFLNSVNHILLNSYDEDLRSIDRDDSEFDVKSVYGQPKDDYDTMTHINMVCHEDPIWERQTNFMRGPR